MGEANINELHLFFLKELEEEGEGRIAGRSERVGFRPVFGERQGEQCLGAEGGGWHN